MKSWSYEKEGQTPTILSYAWNPDLDKSASQMSPIHVKIASQKLRRHIELQTERSLLAILHSKLLAEFGSLDKIDRTHIGKYQSAELQVKSLVARAYCCRQLSSSVQWCSNILNELSEDIKLASSELSVAVHSVHIGRLRHAIAIDLDWQEQFC